MEIPHTNSSQLSLKHISIRSKMILLQVYMRIKFNATVCVYRFFTVVASDCFTELFYVVGICLTLKNKWIKILSIFDGLEWCCPRGILDVIKLCYSSIKLRILTFRSSVKFVVCTFNSLRIGRNRHTLRGKFIFSVASKRNKKKNANRRLAPRNLSGL